MPEPDPVMMKPDAEIDIIDDTITGGTIYKVTHRKEAQ
jgi:hypothetical protein